ncbi:MAG: hypothetical protein K8S18_17035 [Desulfobacula sp.]|nr:hypothetical protein [Desulfobacula sp.]
MADLLVFNNMVKTMTEKNAVAKYQEIMKLAGEIFEKSYGSLNDLLYCSGTNDFIVTYFAGAIKMKEFNLAQTVLWNGRTLPYAMAVGSQAMSQKIKCLWTFISMGEADSSHYLTLVRQSDYFGMYHSNINKGKFYLFPQLNLGGKSYNALVHKSQISALLIAISAGDPNNEYHPDGMSFPKTWGIKTIAF